MKRVPCRARSVPGCAAKVLLWQLNGAGWVCRGSERGGCMQGPEGGGHSPPRGVQQERQQRCQAEGRHHHATTRPQRCCVYVTQNDPK